MGVIDALLIALLYVLLHAFVVVIPLCFFVLPLFYVAIAERRLQYVLVCSFVTLASYLILYIVSEIDSEYDLLFVVGAPIVQIFLCVMCHYIWKYYFRPSKDKPRV